MSNTDLEEREQGVDDFSKIIDANYSKSEKKKLDEIAKKEEKGVEPSHETEPADEPDAGGNSTIPFRNEKKLFKGKGNRRSLAKKALLGGGIGGGIVALIITAFVALLPLKLIHIFENLQRHFFATSESAVQNRTEVLLSDYLKKKVVPGMTIGGPCSRTGTIDKNCVKDSGADSQAGRLYNAWRDARLENTLANKYGVELAKVNNSGNNSYKLTVHGSDTGINLDGWLKSPDNNSKTIWTAMGNRNDVRQTLRKAFEQETLFKRVMYRFKVGRLLERKYGIRRCVFACNSRDKFDDWGDKQSQAAKLVIIRRVVQPHTKFLGIAMECIITNTCGVDHTDDINPDGEDNQRRDVLEKKIADELAKNSIQMGTEDVAKIAKLADEILKFKNSGGFSNYLMQSLIDKLDSEFLSKYGVPVIGWIDSVATVVNTLHDTGPKVARWTFAIGAISYATYYMIQASQASELKSGHTTAGLTGSLVSTFGNTAGEPGHQNQPAENAPLYTALMGSNGPPQRSIISTMLPSALAAAPNNPDLSTKPYTCDDGKELDPTKHLICPEESLVSTNIFTTISDILSKPPWNTLTAGAQLWRASIGRIIKAINLVIHFGTSAIDAAVTATFPPYASMKAAIGNKLNDLIMVLAKWFIPSPISDNMSGARAFDAAAAGADVSGADFAHYGLGAKRVTNQVAARIRDEQENQALQDFQSRPLLARMFDTEDAHSLISQVAMDIPIGSNNIFQSSFASLLSSPFTKLFNSFAIMLPGGSKVHAAAINDPFGVPQYAYDLNDPDAKAAIGINPDLLTDSVCDQMNKDWAAGKGQFAGTLKIDHDTGMDVHTKVDPCLLNASAATSAGGYFSTDVLSKADLGTSVDVGDGPTPPPVGPSGYSNPFHNMSNIVQSRIDEGVDYVAKTGTSVPVFAIGNGVVDIATTSSSFYTTSKGNADWITYHLTDGPAAGKYIYISEGCPNITVKPGDTVTASTHLCDMGDDSIEMGWASGGAIQTPIAQPVYKECHQTAYGINFNALMVKLGAPPGHPDSSSDDLHVPCAIILGGLPNGWPTW